MPVTPKKPVCLYGCSDPAKCPWPHRGCRHCSSVRADIGWSENPDEVLDYKKTYMQGHPT